MKKVAIGVDIGGGSVRLGIVSADGKVLARETFATPKGREKLLRTLVERISILRTQARKHGWKVLGVGIGAPGPIDVQAGRVYFFPNIPGWRHTPLKSLLQRRLKLPVRVDNDAHVMTLAEFHFGAGRGAKNVIALTLGTGIGGGLVMDGRPFHGPHFSAAEIGHLIINEDGPRCACGTQGCVETYVGSGYFVREIRKRLKAGQKSILKKWIKEGRPLTPRLAAQAAKKGDAFSKGIWRETAVHLGSALAGLVNILNPDKIILGGGIAQSGNLLFSPLRVALRKKAFSIAARSVRVVPAALGVDAGLIGAGALFLF